MLVPQITGTQMRKLRIIEHISLDGVIQVSGEGGDFPYGDWTAPYRTPLAGTQSSAAGRGGLTRQLGEIAVRAFWAHLASFSSMKPG